MLRRALWGLAILGGLAFGTSTRAAEPVLLKYKFAKGDQLIYKTVEETKQSQKLLGTDNDTNVKQESVKVFNTEEIGSTGTASLKTKVERRKVTMKSAAGDFTFDSKSNERDTSSAIGGAVTPLLERTTGSDYDVKIDGRGSVLDVKGLAEMTADLVKDNPIAQQFAAGSSKAGAQIAEQEAFVVFSDKPVSVGDQWETPFEIVMEGFGTLKGKVVYTFEGEDKVGDRPTVRIGTTTELTIDLKIDAAGAKVTGTLSTQNSTGTFQFDPQAGKVVSAKRSSTVSGQLTVEAGGMIIPVDTSTEENRTITLLEKLPD